MGIEDSSVQESSYITGAVSHCPTCSEVYADGSIYCTFDGTKLIHTPVELKSRTLFAEKYEILDLLGAGGMGAVYRVRQILIDKIYALKIIPDELLTENLALRFEREAKTMASLDHPNLVAIVDFGVWQKQPFMVMELLEGETLTEIISKGPLSLQNAVEIFRQVLQGLAHAHSKDVLHRDIKPSNIMICRDENRKRAVLLDFGIAKKFENVDREKNLQTSYLALTRTGEMVGSPLYMSPEQARGAKLTPTCDLYSVGCTFFETITGTPPFLGKTAIESMILHLEQKPPTLKEASLGRDFPPSFERFIQKILSKSPDERYQSAEETRRALQLALQLEEEIETPKGIIQTTEKFNLMTVAGAALISLVALSVVAYFAGQKVKSPRIKQDISFLESAFPGEDKKLPLLLEAPVQVSQSSAENGLEPIRQYRGIPDREDDLLSPYEQKAPYYRIVGDEKRLRLPNRILTPQEIKLIENDAFLQFLGLYRTKFPHEMIGKLKGPLTGIRVGQNNITDEDLKYFAKNESLEGIDAADSSIKGSGLKYLAGLKNLVVLDLAHNPIEPHYLSLLSTAPELKHLTLQDVTNFDDHSVKYLLPLKNLKVLTLDDTRITARGIAKLAKIPSLTHLHLRRVDLGDRGLDGLKNFKQLVSLNISNNCITSAGLKKLLPLKNLKNLDLTYNQITDSGIKDLVALKSLEELNISHTEITPKNLVGLAALPNLKKLCVRKIARLNEDHVYQFMKACPSCEEIIFVQNRRDGYTRKEFELAQRDKERRFSQ